MDPNELLPVLRVTPSQLAARALVVGDRERAAQAAQLLTDPDEVGHNREYRTITGKERVLGITQYEEILKRLKRLGLVEPLNGRTLDVRDGEARLRLRGSVRMILPVQTADEMEAWLRKYRVK